MIPVVANYSGLYLPVAGSHLLGHCRLRYRCPVGYRLVTVVRCRTFTVTDIVGSWLRWLLRTDLHTFTVGCYVVAVGAYRLLVDIDIWLWTVPVITFIKTFHTLERRKT